MELLHSESVPDPASAQPPIHTSRVFAPNYGALKMHPNQSFGSLSTNSFSALTHLCLCHLLLRFLGCTMEINSNTSSSKILNQLTSLHTQVNTTLGGWNVRDENVIVKQHKHGFGRIPDYTSVYEMRCFCFITSGIHCRISALRSLHPHFVPVCHHVSWLPIKKMSF